LTERRLYKIAHLLPAVVGEVKAVGASVSAREPLHRIEPIRAVSRCKWLTLKAPNRTVGTASISIGLPWRFSDAGRRVLGVVLQAAGRLGTAKLWS